MKKTLKLSALLVVLLTSFAMSADTTDPVKKVKPENTKTVFSERNNKVYLVLDNPELQAVSLEIRDDLDRLVYSETITDKEAVKKVFNFSKAYTGGYHIRVLNGDVIYNKSIKI